MLGSSVSRAWMLGVLAGGGLLAAAAPARAGLNDPDLTVSISGPGQVTVGGKMTYSLRVANTALHTQLCTPLRGGGVVCFPIVFGSDASNVTVRFTLPTGGTFDGTPTGSGGFTCTTAASVATCTGGAVPMDNFRFISVPARATTTLGPSTATATVAITTPERDATNNDASFAFTATAKPNLLATETASPSPFHTFAPVTYTINIFNQASGPVIDGTIDIFTNLPASLVTWTLGGGFSCNSPSQPGQQLVIHCFGGNMAGFSLAQLQIQVKLFNQSTPSGTPFTLFGNLDPGNAIPETSEIDNSFTAAALVF